MRFPRPVTLLAALLLIGCGSSSVEWGGPDETEFQPGDDDTGDDDDTTAAPDDDDSGVLGDDDDTTVADDDDTTPPTDDDDTTVEPFSCVAAAVSSTFTDSGLAFDPAVPFAGDTLTVAAWAGVDAHSHHITDLVLTAETSDGLRYGVNTLNTGPGPNGWDMVLADVPEGDLCVVFAVDGGGTPVASGKVTVVPRPPETRDATAGVYQVVQNHQKTCAENAWGIDVDLRVEDASGTGVPGVTIEVWHNDDESMFCNGGGGCSALPGPVVELVTDGGGNVSVPNGYCYGEHGLIVWRAGLRDFASDIAVELTTVYWDNTEHNQGTADDSSCSYCGGSTACHWGHSVTWRLSAGAAQACHVPVDHAGQSEACAVFPHARVHPDEHDPADRVCWAVP